MRDSGEDVGEIKFEVMGRGELRMVRLAGFMELGKVGMDRIRMVWRIGSVGPRSGGYEERKQHQQPDKGDQTEFQR